MHYTVVLRASCLAAGFLILFQVAAFSQSISSSANRCPDALPSSPARGLTTLSVPDCGQLVKAIGRATEQFLDAQCKVMTARKISYNPDRNKEAGALLTAAKNEFAEATNAFSDVAKRLGSIKLSKVNAEVMAVLDFAKYPIPNSYQDAFVLLSNAIAESASAIPSQTAAITGQAWRNIYGVTMKAGTIYWGIDILVNGESS